MLVPPPQNCWNENLLSPHREEYKAYKSVFLSTEKNMFRSVAGVENLLPDHLPWYNHEGFYGNAIGGNTNNKGSTLCLSLDRNRNLLKKKIARDANHVVTPISLI
jgi:hypothetical protein